MGFHVGPITAATAIALFVVLSVVITKLVRQAKVSNWKSPDMVHWMALLFIAAVLFIVPSSVGVAASDRGDIKMAVSTWSMIAVSVLLLATLTVAFMFRAFAIALSAFMIAGGALAVLLAVPYLSMRGQVTQQEMRARDETHQIAVAEQQANLRVESTGKRPLSEFSAEELDENATVVEGAQPKHIEELVFTYDGAEYTGPLPESGATSRSTESSNGKTVKSVGWPMKVIPQWAKEPFTVTEGDRTRHVLMSKRYATEDEARDDLEVTAQAALNEYMQKRYPGISGMQIENDMDDIGALKRELVVTYPLQVGEFEEEVKQIYWQLELTPEMGEKIAAAWRPNEVHQRLIYLAVGLAAVTLLMGLGAVLTRPHHA